MADEVDLVRSRIDLVALIGQSVSLKKAGKEFKGLCPFHNDRNPSFTVSNQLGRYRCWSCGASGDCFTWVMHNQRVEFPEALRLLAKEAGVELKPRSGAAPRPIESLQAAMKLALDFFREQLGRNQEARDYCHGRGLDAETLDRWEIGYAPSTGSALADRLAKVGHKLSECRELFLVDEYPRGGFYDRFRGRLMFPIRNERGDLVAFGGRLLGQGQPKYINSSDTPLYRKSRVLYGLMQAKEALGGGQPAVLVEGYLDVIACHRAGVASAVAPLGTALGEDHAKLLKRWTEDVVLLFDGDAAGEKATLRSAEILGAAGLRYRVATLAQGEDPDSVLRREGPGPIRAAVEQAMPLLDFRLASLDRRLEPSDEAYWQEAIEILSASANPLEAERHLLPLAARYPGVRNVVEAEKALRRMVAAARRSPGPAPAPARQAAVAGDGLLGAERTLLRALFLPEVARLAWEALRAEDLVETEPARAAVASLRRALGAEGPVGESAAWLGRIEPEEVRDLLTRVVVSNPLDNRDSREEREEPADAPRVEAAIAALESRLQEQDLAELARRAKEGDPEAFLEYARRRRQIES